MMDWNDLRFFLALARTGSVRAAGAALGVSHSTVARRVEALEADLAARLFDRSRDGYALTDAGQLMVARAKGIEAHVSALERDVVGQDERLSGPVSLTCCDHDVADLVIGGLAAFCGAHPEIELSLTTDSRSFDLARREADIAIRIMARDAEPPGFLLGRRVAPLVIASYVAVAFAERLDPDVAAEPPRWLSGTDRGIQEAMAAGSSHPQLASWGAFSSIDLLVRAARAGLGVVMLPTYVGDRDPTLQRLRRPDLRHVAQLWVLSHPDLRDNARIRATRQQVCDVFACQAALFRGEA